MIFFLKIRLYIFILFELRIFQKKPVIQAKSVRENYFVLPKELYTLCTGFETETFRYFFCSINSVRPKTLSRKYILPCRVYGTMEILINSRVLFTGKDYDLISELSIKHDGDNDDGDVNIALPA